MTVLNPAYGKNGGAPADLGDIGNVDTSGVQNNWQLYWDATSQTWIVKPRDGGFRGTYADPAALNAAVPDGVPGDWAEVLSTNTVWTWATSWVDSGTPTMGDMNKAIYDPQNINGDAFDRANMTGVQAISTITGLQALLDSKVAGITAGNATITIGGTPTNPTIAVSVSVISDIASKVAGVNAADTSITIGGTPTNPSFKLSDALQSTIASALQQVTSNDTLSGLGTTGSPLGVQQLFALRDSADQSLWRTGQTTEGLINQGAALEDYFGAPLVFTAARSRFHQLNTFLSWSLDSTTQDIIFQVEISGDQGFSTVFTLPAEPTDAGGGGGAVLNTLSGGVITGTVAAGTTQVYVLNAPVWFLLTAGETYTVTLRWGRSGGGAIEAAIYRAQFSVIEAFGAPIS